MAEGGSPVLWGWLDHVWGDGCWQRWANKGREGRPGLSAGVSDLGVDRIRAAAAPFLGWRADACSQGSAVDGVEGAEDTGLICVVVSGKAKI